MPNLPRKIPFVMAATDHGTLILNRFDRHITGSGVEYGVGSELLNKGSYEPAEVNLLLTLLDLRRKWYGDGVVAIDCGANVGVHTIEWAKHLAGWGSVLAIEAQERIYYALAGNIAINNCFNARVVHAALTSQPGTMKIPSLDYLAPASFGSLELRRRASTEFIGQVVDYSEDQMVDVRAISLDSLNLDRVDLIKLDIEGMELDALAGCANCIASHHPVFLIEMIKNDKKELLRWLEYRGYLALETGANFAAVHHADKCLAQLKAR